MKSCPVRRLARFLPLIITLLGAAGGFAFYYLVGCPTGSCPISSNPVIMTLYGALMGYLLGIIVTPEKKKDN